MNSSCECISFRFAISLENLRAFSSNSCFSAIFSLLLSRLREKTDKNRINLKEKQLRRDNLQVFSQQFVFRAETRGGFLKQSLFPLNFLEISLDFRVLLGKSLPGTLQLQIRVLQLQTFLFKGFYVVYVDDFLEKENVRILRENACF